MSMSTLPTRNKEWGFWGATRALGEDYQLAVWEIAARLIEHATDAGPDAVRAFLDSRHGRHFADTVCDQAMRRKNMEAAVASAVAQWLSWRITPRIEREHGIPRGLPYLVGYVIHAGIEADLEDERKCV
jgi:hypothetical protein